MCSPQDWFSNLFKPPVVPESYFKDLHDALPPRRSFGSLDSGLNSLLELSDTAISNRDFALQERSDRGHPIVRPQARRITPPAPIDNAPSLNFTGLRDLSRDSPSPRRGRSPRRTVHLIGRGPEPVPRLLFK